MKQQIITGLKKKLLLVELPEGATYVNHSRALGNSMIVYKIKGQDAIRPIPTSDWKLIGKLTDITEEQFAEYVEKEFDTFRDYTQEDSVGSFVVNTAKESFFSKLEADGIYCEPKNTLDKPNINDYDFGHGHNESELYNKHLKSWQEVQEKVWDKERIWLFEVI